MFFCIPEHYPDFEPQFDETGSITIADYMYVLSLLMHFACVRQSEHERITWFQEICLNLNEKCQLSVGKFFQIMSRHEKFDRNSIRQAISTSTPAVPRLSFMHLSTPISTPVKGNPTTQDLAHLLDTKNYEAKSLRAQLEGEKHERGYLESQVQEMEEKLNKYGKQQQLFKYYFWI